MQRLGMLAILTAGVVRLPLSIGRTVAAPAADIAAPRDDEGQDDRGDELFSHSSPSSGGA